MCSSVVENQAPDEYVCPITQEFMVDPVTCADGHSYEKAEIERRTDLFARTPGSAFQRRPGEIPL